MLKASLRAELQKATFEGDSDTASEQFQDYTWRFQAKHEPKSAFKLTYLLQKGFRGGGFNTGADLSSVQRSFEPESLYHLEVSVAKAFASSQLLLRGFHYCHRDQQIQSSQQLDPTDPNTFTYFTDNVASSRTVGVEAGYFVHLGEHMLQSNLGLLDSEFEEYSLDGKDLKSRSLAHAPQWTALARWTWQHQNWSLYSQVHGRDSFFYSEDHNFKAPQSLLTDVGVKFRWSDLEAEVFVNNVFDESHYLRAYYFANEPPEWEPKLYEQPGAPRIWGLRLQWFL